MLALFYFKYIYIRYLYKYQQNSKSFLKKVAKATISMLRFICMGERKSLSLFVSILEIDFEPNSLMIV